MLSRSIAPPVITDRQALEEFSESLSDLAPKIERDVARLRAVPGVRATVSSLFRAIHNIKGDAALCRIDLAVQVVHPVETVLTRLRNGERLLCTALFREQGRIPGRVLNEGHS